MNLLGKTALCLSLLAGLAGLGFGAEGEASAKAVNRAEAYYNFSMGHLYAELAMDYGNRGEYLAKAIDHYKQAIQADPAATFLTEELAGLYIQAGRLNEAVTELEGRLKKNPQAVDARRVLGHIYWRLIGDPRTNRINEEMLKKAIEQYRKIVEIEPKDTDSWLLLGRLYKGAQDSVESEKAFRKALELDPSSEEALTGLAMVYSSLGDNKRAIEMLSQAAGRSPSMRSLTNLAEAFESVRDYANASQALRRALELEPANLDLKRALAQDLLFANKLDEAVRTYTEITETDPKDSQSYLRISQIYRQMRDFQKARQALERAKQLEPDGLEVRDSEVYLLEAEGRRSEAIARMKELVDSTEKKSYTTPERATRAVFLERLAELYRSNEQYQQAIAVFRQIAELDPDLAPRTAAQVVDTLRQAKAYARAAEEADAAASKYPNDRRVALMRASILAEVGKAEQAVAQVRKLSTGDDDREALLALAQVYEKAKDYREMGKALDAAEKLSVSEDDKGTVYFMRGAMHERMKNYEAAEAEFRKALALDPDNASVLNYLGYMLADRNLRLEEAHKMISRALELDPDNGAYLDSLGWVYYRMGKLEEAETYLHRALEQVSRDATVRDHLGDVLSQRGKLREAIAEWQISVKEWEASSPAERDPAEIAKVSKKLEGAKVRLAQESSGAARRP
jgi:tetratricopeptide (TPR) repeat protein